MTTLRLQFDSNLINYKTVNHAINLILAELNTASYSVYDYSLRTGVVVVKTDQFQAMVLLGKLADMGETGLIHASTVG